MNKILIVLGDLATGKSTYCKMIANRYHCLTLSKDNIKEILADDIGFKNRDENKKLSIATVQVMFYVFKNLIHTKQDIVLEANFHNDELKQLYEIIANSNYNALTLNLTADMNILFDRFMKRAKLDKRHPAHLTDDLMDYDSFKDYILKSRNLEILGPKIDINANDFSYQNEDNFCTLDQFFKDE